MISMHRKKLEKMYTTKTNVRNSRRESSVPWGLLTVVRVTGVSARLTVCSNSSSRLMLPVTCPSTLLVPGTAFEEVLLLPTADGGAVDVKA